MLHNLLPPLRTEYIEEDRRAQINDWKPAEAHPTNGKLSRTLLTLIEDTNELNVQNVLSESAKHPQKEPNVAHINQVTLTDLLLNGSPLCVAHRGIADVPLIGSKKVSRENVDDLKIGIKAQLEDPVLVLKMLNWMSSSADLFVQNKMQLQTFNVPPGHNIVRAVNTDKKAASTACDMFCILFSTLKVLAVAMTARQEVRDFHFSTEERVGLEVELSNNRLVCCQVYEGTQAEQYSKALDGAEILAVNGRRVLTLDDFRFEMGRAKIQGEIVIKAASYASGFSKSGDLFHDLKRQRALKTLLSNMMQVSSKDDYQKTYDLSNLDHDDDDDDDDEEEEDLADKDGDIPMGSGHADSVSAVTAASMSASIQLQDRLHSSSQDEGDDGDYGPPSYIFNTSLAERGNNDDLDSSDGGLMAAKRRPAMEQDQDSQTTVRSIKIEQAVEKKSKQRSEKEKWTYTTNPNPQASMMPFLTLLCMPRLLSASEGWVHPSRYLQVTNFSSQWLLEVNWVDEDGALVPRAGLKSGKTHIERCSPDHVWLVTALPTNRSGVLGGNSVASQTQSSVCTTSVDSLQGDAMLETEQKADSSAAVVVLRASRASLQLSKCTSLLWTPRSSLSIAQRVYSKNSKVAPAATLATADGDVSDIIQPHIHLQVFDLKTAGSNSSSGVSGEVAVEKKSSKPLRLPKWPLKQIHR